MLEVKSLVAIARCSKRWSRHVADLQESSPEVSSSNAQPENRAVAEVSAIHDDSLHIWDLDLDRGKRAQSDGSNESRCRGSTATVSERASSPTFSPTIITTVQGIDVASARRCSRHRVLIFTITTSTLAARERPMIVSRSSRESARLRETCFTSFSFFSFLSCLFFHGKKRIC